MKEKREKRVGAAKQSRNDAIMFNGHLVSRREQTSSETVR